MLARCYTKSATGFDRYGARGVTVCDRWRQSFEAFLTDMGEAPDGMSLERTKNEEGYAPENCIWATRQRQNENRRSVEWIEFGGERLTKAGWARRLGISKATLYERLEKWPLGQALGFEARPPQDRSQPRGPMSEAGRRNISEAAKHRKKASPR
jgi:hypothetical protein